MPAYLRLYFIFYLASAPIYAATFFIDAHKGNDNASGTSEESAWQSLARVQEIRLQAGDQVLLKSGQIFFGQFYTDQSGKLGEPIILSAYGIGPKPVIASEGKFRAAVHLDNAQYWIVQGVEITNKGAEPKAKRCGLLISANKGGVLRDIIVRGNTVRDINGVFSKDAGGGTGIRWEVSNQNKPTRLDGLLIENNHLIRCDRDGIKGWMQPWSDLSNLSTNTVIRGNLLEDIGGDGIVIIGTEGTLVEYNRLYGLRERILGINEEKEVSLNAGPSIGIWPWSSKNTHIRFNEVWGYEGTFDGQGLDSDWNCEGTLFEYNLSADNKGGFFLICTWSKLEESGESIGNVDTLIRHNISLNDHVRGFVLNGPVRNLTIDGNIIFNTIEDRFQVVIDTPWENGHFSDSVSFTNNLVYTRGSALISQGVWHPSGLGLWKPSQAINRETIYLSGNSYTNVEGFGGTRHEEPGIKKLTPIETLGSLIKSFDQNQAAKKGFGKMLEFLKGSRNWAQIKATL